MRRSSRSRRVWAPRPAASLVSIGTGWIWLVPFWGWLGRRYGLRRLLQAGYAMAGVLSMCAAFAFGIPWLGAALLVLAAFGTETIDGAGNLLFLRAVHAYERSEMTTVFVSFRDVAQLGPPAVCSVLLSLFSLPSVFVAAGVMMLGSSVLSRHISPALIVSAAKCRAFRRTGMAERALRWYRPAPLCRRFVRDALFRQQPSSSPDWNISVTMSQPPTNSPFT